MNEQVEARKIKTPPPPRRGPTDEEAVNGPNADEIASLLTELGQIAKVDLLWRSKLKRRDAIWVRLRTLGVTQARMCSNYAVNGKPISDAAVVSLALTRHDRKQEKEKAK
jgi:hypothetical protein